MRHARTYRADRKRRAKAMGLSLVEYAKVEARAKELAAQKVHQLAMTLSPEQARQARRALGIWTQSGGKINALTGEGIPAAQRIAEEHSSEVVYETIIEPEDERPIYNALKEPAPEGTPQYDGEIGQYRGVTIHGR